MKRLAILTTHPIQYNAPFFRLLACRQNVQIKVFYSWGSSVLKEKFDPGFQQEINWDIPLLDGYDYYFLKNTSDDPGSHHYYGIVNPDAIKDIATWNPDAILIYGWSFQSHLKIMRYFADKIPVYFRGDSTLINKNNVVKAMIRKLFLKWVYSHVSAALYVGTNNRDYFRNSGLREDRLVFVPHAIDNDRFIRGEQELQLSALAWREELNIAANQLVFLFAAKLDDNKNARLLLEAFIDLQIKDTHLVIAGSGIYEKQLKAEFGSANNIYFLPFQNQRIMPVLYRLGDVFVVPSKSETWGLSINEAMACGRAIIASNTCGAAIDLVINGKNGYTFLSGNKDDLKAQLRKCINNNEYIHMGKESSKIISQYNYSTGAEQIESLMNDGKYN